MGVEAEDALVAQRVGSIVAGKWTVERLLGTGGTAAVYAARGLGGSEAALKFLHPEMSRRKDVRERFLREAYAANRLNHPGAVRVLEHGGDGEGEEAYLVMELLRGESLSTRVQRMGRLSVQELFDYLDQVLDVLAAAHGLGVIHRDLKPDNLFVTSEGKIKILDFGLARLEDSAPTDFKTRPGSALGTLPYMAPEQAMGRPDQIDGRTDLFALGATAFRILSGRRIHEIQGEAELLSAMASLPAPPLNSVVPELSSSICGIVDTAVAFAKEARYPDARTMQADVRAVRAGQLPPFASQHASARAASTRANPIAPAASGFGPPPMITVAGRHAPPLPGPLSPPGGATPPPPLVPAGGPPMVEQRSVAHSPTPQPRPAEPPQPPAEQLGPPRLITSMGRSPVLPAQQVAPAVQQHAPPVMQQHAPPVMQQHAPPVMQQPAPPVMQQPAPPVMQQPAPPILQRGAPPSAVAQPQAIFGGAAAQVIPQSPAPPAPPQAAPAPPQAQFQVKNMFGLRGFGQRSGAHASPAAGGSLPRPGAAPAAPPPLMAQGPLGLPPLRDARSDPAPRRDAGSQDVEHLLNRMGRDKQAAPAPTKKPGRMAQPQHARQTTSARWIILAVAAVGVGILAIVAVFVFASGDKQADASTVNTATPADPVGSASGNAIGDELPRSKLLSSNESLGSMLRQVHAHGGKEAPELRALVDEHAALAASVLRDGSCGKANADPRCATIEKMREMLVDMKPLTVKKRERDPNKPLSRWLQGLKMPAIPVEDDPRVQRFFEFYTENTVGRETFQSMLFRCGAYRDLIHATLIRHGLPKDLLALVMMESTCSPLAKSPVGAAGLWQFMPDTARAYHLRVQEGVVDERLNPFKATEAGVRFLTHLYEKLNSWDLVFASYNAGPFGVIGRVQRAGGDVGFWDLVDADLLPEETSNYAPGIQALALINENLQKLRFAGSQMRAPQMTADLEAPAGTRLSMIARAAAMSTTSLRQLNLDIVGDAVPKLPGGFAVQVPKDVVWQARDTLKALLAQKDDADRCVSASFDWGKQHFSPEMAKTCQRNLKTAD